MGRRFRNYLEDENVNGFTDSLANIAVIGPTINIRISAKAPLDYVKRYKITPQKLEQQFIEPSFTDLQISEYETWTRQRAERLALEASAFLAELRNGI